MAPASREENSSRSSTIDCIRFASSRRDLQEFIGFVPRDDSSMHGLNHAVNRGERRPQLMRHPSQQIGADLFQLLQARGHVAEGGAKLLSSCSLIPWMAGSAGEYCPSIPHMLSSSCSRLKH